MSRDLAFFRRLPKAELHCHLDGSLRPQTMLALAAEDRVHLPYANVDALKRGVRAGEIRQSLEDYLTAFTLTLSVLQTEHSIERAAYELAIDCAAENVLRLEVRFSPVLHQSHGLTLEAIVEAALSGLGRGAREAKISAGVILCGIRNLSPQSSLQIAELAVAYGTKGVVGFDLAGPEVGYPALLHREAFARAHAGGVAITVHAGEAEGAWSVAEAMDEVHATRVGHGTHLIDDPALLVRARDRGLGVEVCLQSNLETQSVTAIAEHPFARFLRAGVRATLNTDNRLMSDTDLSGEYARAASAFSLTDAEIAQTCMNGALSAFVSPADRVALCDRFAAALSALALPSPRA